METTASTTVILVTLKLNRLLLFIFIFIYLWYELFFRLKYLMTYTFIIFNGMNGHK